jgi:predicted peroxiredoxin
MTLEQAVERLEALINEQADGERYGTFAKEAEAAGIEILVCEASGEVLITDHVSTVSMFPWGAAAT